MRTLVQRVLATSVAVLCTIASPHAQVAPAFVLVPVLDPPPNAAGWNNTRVIVAFQCQDVRDCPGPVVVDTQGAAQQLSRSVVHAGGRAVTVGVSVNLDLTAPRIQILSTELQPAGALAVSARITDDLSGVSEVACNGRPARGSAGLVRCNIPMYDGVNDVAVTALDAAGNSASSAKQITRPATSIDTEIMPEDMILRVGDSRPVQFLDSAGQEIDGASWTIENPSVATLDARAGTVTGTAPGETIVNASLSGRAAHTKLTVVAADATLPMGTVLWGMHPRQGLTTGWVAIPERLPDGPDMIYVGRHPRDGYVLLRATTIAGRVLWDEYAALAPVERLVDWMGDRDGGILLWANSGARSAIVRTGRPGQGVLWRYECASPVEGQWAMSWAGTLFVVEKAETGFSHVTGLDSRTGGVKFRVPVPHTLGEPGGTGRIFLPTGTEAVMMFLSRAPAPRDTPAGTEVLRVGLLHMRDDGSARMSTVIDFPESDLPMLRLGGVYPDGHDGLVALMQRRYPDGRADGFIVRLAGEERSSYVLPTIGEYVLGENDEAFTSDDHLLVAFHPVTGKVRWTRAAPADGKIRLDFATTGGGVVVDITGGPEPGKYRLDANGARALVRK